MFMLDEANIDTNELERCAHLFIGYLLIPGAVISKTQFMALPSKRRGENSGTFMHDMTHFKFTQLRTWPEAWAFGTVLCMAHF